jgi:hypothetical protein
MRPLALTTLAVAALVFPPDPCSAQGTPPLDSATVVARRTALVSDLRNVATAQEAYFADHARYARTYRELTGYRTSSGVTLYVAVSSTTSHSAVAVHRDVPDLICGIAFGAPNPVSGEPADGTVTCRMPDGAVFNRPPGGGARIP